MQKGPIVPNVAGGRDAYLGQSCIARTPPLGIELADEGPRPSGSGPQRSRRVAGRSFLRQGLVQEEATHGLGEPVGLKAWQGVAGIAQDVVVAPGQDL